MKSTHFRISTLMILIFDVAVLLGIWNLRSPDELFGSMIPMIIQFLVGIILFFFTLMVVLGFRPRRASQVSRERIRED
jgi:hypothetical protein